MQPEASVGSWAEEATRHGPGPRGVAALSPATHARLARQFAAEPAYAFVGLKLIDLGPGLCRSVTPLRPEILHHRGALQGGLVAMIADATAGYAALATLAPDVGEDDMATIEFKTAFYRPVVGAVALCRAEAAFCGRSTVFCRAQVYDEVEEQRCLAAEATLTFRRLPRRVREPDTGHHFRSTR